MVNIKSLADLHPVLEAEQAFIVLWSPGHEESEELIRNAMSFVDSGPGIKVAIMNVDAVKGWATLFPTCALPALVLIKDGAHFKTIEGALSPAEFSEQALALRA